MPHYALYRVRVCLLAVPDGHVMCAVTMADVSLVSVAIVITARGSEQLCSVPWHENSWLRLCAQEKNKQVGQQMVEKSWPGC